MRPSGVFFEDPNHLIFFVEVDLGSFELIGDFVKRIPKNVGFNLSFLEFPQLLNFSPSLAFFVIYLERRYFLNFVLNQRIDDLDVLTSLF